MTCLTRIGTPLPPPFMPRPKLPNHSRQPAPRISRYCSAFGATNSNSLSNDLAWRAGFRPQSHKKPAAPSGCRWLVRAPRTAPTYDWSQIANVTRGWLEYLIILGKNDGTFYTRFAQSWEINDDATISLRRAQGCTWNLTGTALPATTCALKRLPAGRAIKSVEGKFDRRSLCHPLFDAKKNGQAIERGHFKWSSDHRTCRTLRRESLPQPLIDLTMSTPTGNLSALVCRWRAHSRFPAGDLILCARQSWLPATMRPLVFPESWFLKVCPNSAQLILHQFLSVSTLRDCRIGCAYLFLIYGRISVPSIFTLLKTSIIAHHPSPCVADTFYHAARDILPSTNRLSHSLSV